MTERDPSTTTPAPISTRRYGWAVGIVALALVIGFVLYTLSSHRSGTEGVPAGAASHFFAAPLAASTLNGDANVNPPCTLARHDPRALNVCLLVKRGPLVLDFFVTNSSQCEREVDTMQSLSRRRAFRRVQWAAVAVNGSHAATAKAVRRHGWTIPVAYDADGAVGGLYGVSACPLLELVDRGGTVAQRLIGEHWLNRGALAARVRALIEPR
ncbi:MAG: TlpA disulfide reductase family protein [Solirubrobacteraceae bacterium]